ncbi:MAG: hypothetical protein L0241_23075 [Planctomycetia bacterium]|nr:hypothetical protein [Planctomycetia bacterium]
MQMRRTTFARAVALLALLALIGGCTQASKPIVKVEGKIKFNDGKPLPAGTKLMFNPTEGRTGTATATTEADGSFKLTHVSGSSGAEVGKYTIQVLPPTEAEKEFYKQVSKDKAEGSLFAEIKEGMGPLELTLSKGK